MAHYGYRDLVPYLGHPSFPTPSDDTVIWRYMNLVKFMYLLETRNLYFCRADHLGDPFEGSLLKNTFYRVATIDMTTGETTSSVEHISEGDEKSRKLRSTVQHKIVESMFISCWYAREVDSAAMWTIYASPSDGLAIRSTVGRLKAALVQSEAVIYIGSVSYMDFETAESHGPQIVFTDLLRKRQSFDHEHEVRALINVLDDAPDGGIDIPILLDSLIEDVVIAPQADAWFAELVRSIVMRYELPIEPKHSPLATKPFFGE